MSEQTTIVGPPGTGKTTYLTRQIRRAAEKFGRDGVVVASLTKAAAAEIQGRDLEVNPAHVGTLHAICYRALGLPPLVGKLVAEFNARYGHKLSGDDSATESSLDDLNGDPKDEEGGSPSDKTLGELNLYRARMTPRVAWPARVRRFAADYEAFKAETGTVDFADMIERAHERIDTAPGDPGVIIYDEAQDGSALELALIRKWSTRAEHTVIAGDEDQALYTWRGASVASFLTWSERKIVLDQSYRLPRAVWAVAEAWVRQIQERMPKVYAPRDADGGVQRLGCTIDEPEAWLPLVEAEVEAGRSVMVLATCGYMLRPFLALARSRGLPVHNPYRLRNGAWNGLGKRKGVGAVDRIAAFLQVAGAAGRPWTWAELGRWLDPVRAEVLPRGTKARVAEAPAPDAVVPYRDVEALVGSLALGAAERGALEWYAGALITSKAAPMQYPLAVARYRGPAALFRHADEVQGRPGRGVCVGTVHSVKGGQVDTVLLFPDLSPSAHDQYDTYGKTGTDVVAGRDSVLRTIYVGMTRARENLWLGEPGRGYAVEW